MADICGMTTEPKRAGALAVVLLAVTMSSAAHAQIGDHRAFQTMFGEPVTTAATGLPKRASQVPATVEIITAEQIERMGARDIPSILRRVIGLDVWSFGAGQAEIGIRGNNAALNPRLLVQIDGRPVYNIGLTLVSWSSIPVEIDEIRQIEVVKGPQSALYGFNAVSGVINIVTRDPLGEPIRRVRLVAGSDARREVSAVLGTRLSERFGTRVSLGLGRHADFSGSTIGPTGGRTDPIRRSFRLDSGAELGGGFGLRTEVSNAVSDRHFWIIGGLNQPSRQEATGAKVELTHDGAHGLASITASHTDSAIRAAAGSAEPGIEKNTVSRLRLQHVFQLGGEHAFRVGVEGFQALDRSDRRPDGRNLVHSYGASAVWDWTVLRDLTLTTALRFDRWILHRSGPVTAGDLFTNGDVSQTFGEPSFNVGAVWRATDVDSIRLSGGRGVQLPSAFELGRRSEVRVGNFQVVYVGQPRLEPTRVDSIELGWDRVITAIDGRARTTLFAQNMENIRSLPGIVPDTFLPTQPTPTPLSLVRDAGRTQTAGVEVDIMGAIAGGWTWRLGYAAQATRDQLNINRGGVISHDLDPAGATPRHRFLAGLGWEGAGWQVDMFLRGDSGYRLAIIDPVGFRFTRMSIPSHATLTARVAHRPVEHLEIALTGEGIERTRRVETFGPRVERRLFMSVAVDF
jgi:iron complex outermembrane receptor protein